jgi:hypothetical protein
MWEQLLQTIGKKTKNLKIFSIYYINMLKKSLKHLYFKPETLVV